jgi:hypothetical protein
MITSGCGIGYAGTRLFQSKSASATPAEKIMSFRRNDFNSAKISGWDI